MRSLFENNIITEAVFYDSNNQPKIQITMNKNKCFVIKEWKFERWNISVETSLNCSYQEATRYAESILKSNF